MADRIDMHKKLCELLNYVYIRKNHDYGNSFGESIKEEGLAAARIRIGDKWNRFKNLSRQKISDQKVKDESMRDTLLDMANYCLMTVVEMDAQTLEDIGACGNEEEEHGNDL